MELSYPTKLLLDPIEAQAYGAGAYSIVGNDYVTLLWIVLPSEFISCFRLKANGGMYGIDPGGAFIGWNGVMEKPSLYYPLQRPDIAGYSFVLWDGIMYPVEMQSTSF